MLPIPITLPLQPEEIDEQTANMLREQMLHPRQPSLRTRAKRLIRKFIIAVTTCHRSPAQ